MTYDCIVIGGGVVGSSAAYHLAREGRSVLLLEQFSLPHTRGSSHGPTRALRLSYSVPLYAHMTKEALQIWKRLERETDTRLFHNTGMLVFDQPPYVEFEKLQKPVVECGSVCTGLTHEELNRRYPGTFDIPAEYKIYLEPNAGSLRADKALDSLRHQIKHYGGEIQDEERVEKILPGPVVTVKTNKGEYRAKHLIMTPGSWISHLLKPLGVNLPFRVVRLTVCYFKERVHGSTRNIPTFNDLPAQIYGLPSSEYEGLMKICHLYGVDIDSPDHRDVAVSRSDDVETLCHYVKKRFPGLETPPSIMEPCMYTMTPDCGFIIDSLPHHPNIVFGSGFSGHGFKMAPVVGRILCELAFGEKLSYDISILRMDRFEKAPKSLLSSSL